MSSSNLNGNRKTCQKFTLKGTAGTETGITFPKVVLVGTAGTNLSETCQKHILMGTTGTKTGRTFKIEGEMVQIGTN